MAVTLTYEDLTPFAPDLDEDKAQALIGDALAMAARIAPCILDEGFPYADAAKAILRGAVLRWNDGGAGVYKQVQSGPFQETIDTRQARKSLFFPSEISELQAMCGIQRAGSAFTIDTTPIREAGS
ncbi:hypothetical protein ABQE69_09050 [Mycolicibacillus trivialis]